MGELRKFRIAKLKRFAVLLLLGLLVAGTGIQIYCRFHIEGTYYDPYMACDCSWIFKEGQIYMATEGSRIQAATYARSGSQWICHGGASSEFSGAILQSSFLGVTWFNPQFSGGKKFMPRRCFAWYADMEDWLQNHWHVTI